MDLTLSGIFATLSLALFSGGFMSPVAGILTERHGGRLVMIRGALAGGTAKMTLSRAAGQIVHLVSILLFESAATFVLYPVAFATILRLDMTVPPQRSIGIVTLFGGVASTILTVGPSALQNDRLRALFSTRILETALPFQKPGFHIHGCHRELRDLF